MTDTPSSTEPLGNSAMTPQRRFVVVGMVGGMVFLVLVCIALGAVLLSRSRGGADLGRATATAAPGQPSGLTLAGPGGSVPLTQTAPSKLEIKGRTFEVIPVEVARGAWPFQRDSLRGDKAAWVYGTLINYVVGLEANPDNTSLLQSLAETDAIKMTTLSGRLVAFRYSGRQWVTVDKTDVFRQVRPGMTLVLLGEKGDQRLVVSAGYVAEAEPSPAKSALAQVGTSVEAPGALVQVLSGKPVKNVPGLPSGNAYYQIDFSVKSTGASPLDAGLFQMELIDAAGKRYLASVPASQGGSYGPPGGQLLPGLTLTATVGFVVPDTLPGTSVIWTFSPQAGSKSPARFQLPVAGPTATPDARAQVEVQVTQARYAAEGQEIIISGGLGNTAQKAVTLSLADISLQSGGTLIQVNSTEPPLPWVVQPGQNLAFVVHFARPPAGKAILRMLQASFELDGLQ